MLPEPSTDAGRVGLAALLASPSRALIGLDFDGTLAPIVPDPDAARGHPDVPAVLTALAELGAQIAVVTGRPAQKAVDYAGIAGVPRLVVLGHYGLERWEAGEVSAPEGLEAVEQVRQRLPEVLAASGAPEGTFVEDKGAAVAVHTRRTADPQAAFDLLREPLVALAEDVGLVVEPGRFVLELRPAGGDKGDAMRTLVAELGSESGTGDPSVVVFVGDDLGDLAAFAAVEAMRADGLAGLCVCSGSTEVTALAQKADVVVDGPDGVMAFFAAVLSAHLTG